MDKRTNINFTLYLDSPKTNYILAWWRAVALPALPSYLRRCCCPMYTTPCYKYGALICKSDHASVKASIKSSRVACFPLNQYWKVVHI
jgi:hypothetical protein